MEIISVHKENNQQTHFSSYRCDHILFRNYYRECERVSSLKSLVIAFTYLMILLGYPLALCIRNFMCPTLSLSVKTHATLYSKSIRHLNLLTNFSRCVEFKCDLCTTLY